MKKKIINVLNGLGLIIIITTGFIFLEFFSMGILESVRLCVMGLYVYIALTIPWIVKESKKTKVLSAIGMMLFPLGFINNNWWYFSAIVVLFSVYLFVVHDILDDATSLEA